VQSALAVTLGLVVGLGLVAPATADDLDDRKAQLNGQVATAQEHVDGASVELEAANARVEAAIAQVTAAQAALEQAEAEVAAARAYDELMAGELAAAQATYRAAETKQNNGQVRVENERTRLGEVARSAFQQNSDLVNIAQVLNPMSSTADLANRIQWAHNALSTNQANVQRLETIQRELADAKNNTEVAEARADQAKAAAAQHLAETEVMEAQAREAKAALDAALAEQQAAQDAAQVALSQSQKNLADLVAERDRVNAEIAARAEAARQAELARQRAEAAAAAAAAAAQNNGGGSGYAPPSGGGSSGLINPVPGAYLTSPYGYRINPISGRSELHDGADMGAGCGTPIRSAASGTVTQAYFNSGYGNRIFVDHGMVNGSHMVTAYNHMSGFAASPGQWVGQGQVIGYVGTTGYSTGCHLHFMLWVNGGMRDPWPYI
jgi:murein DD-endopeptidase MepM/ murein hydrolase activator NlpD